MSCAQARCGTRIRSSPGLSRAPASTRTRSCRQWAAALRAGTPAFWSRAATKSRRVSASRSAGPLRRPEQAEPPMLHRRTALSKLPSRTFKALAFLAALYPLIRRPILTWGATSEEAASRLPGDELLEGADGVSTRAITIDAPATSVWPWLAQMGPSPRGGAYTYDWIENLLGLKMHSADRILTQFQHPDVGDTIGLGANQMRLELVEPRRVLAWRSEDGNWVWTFVLEEHEGATRLISRNRFRLPTLAARIAMLPMEPGSLVMERKMLRGIKERAERLASATPDGSSRDTASV